MPKPSFVGDRLPVDVERERSKGDSMRRKSDAEIDQWIDNNVNNMEDVRSALKRLFKMHRS